MNTDIPPFLAHASWITRKIEEVMEQEPDGEQMLSQFPRDIAALASHTLDIPVLRQPHLTVHNAQKFLCILRGAPSSDTALLDRPLYGLLHIGPPSNFILIEEELPPPVANYVLAHELGHFFADIFLVRQRWSQTFPENVQEVRKLFSWQQRNGWLELQALVRGLPPKPQGILARGKQERPETAQRELLADLIAREFLAPWRTVVPLYAQDSAGGIVNHLTEQFGLPMWVAQGYQKTLDATFSPPPTFIDRLFGPSVRHIHPNTPETP